MSTRGVLAKRGSVMFIVVPQDGEAHTYEADKQTLASSSQVFRTIFEKLPDNVKKHVITVTEFSPRAFKLMLRHVFEKPYALNDWKLVLEVFAVAKKYQITSLQQACEEFFAKRPITSSSALEMFEMAAKYGAQKVQSACEEVFENDEDIMLKPGFRCAGKDIVKKIVHCKTHLPPKHLLALINWGMYECRRREKTVNGDNVKRCVLDVCGTRLSRRVSAAMEKLNAIKKSRHVNIPVEKKSLQHGYAVSIPLRGSVSGTLMYSFSLDIICELKISVLKGILAFSGIKLFLKPHTIPGWSPLDIFYSAENVVEGVGVSDVKVNDITKACDDIMFSQGLIVKSGQLANIMVRIEDLQMSRCLENVCVQQEIVDGNDVHFRIACRSSHASSTDTGPFFIEKLYYNKVSSFDKFRRTHLV